MNEISATTIKVDDQSAIELYRAAFDQVHPKDDWRGPIDCLVRWELANLYMQAIQFMTATYPACWMVSIDGRDYAHITCVGYRNGPAGS